MMGGGVTTDTPTSWRVDYRHEASGKAQRACVASWQDILLLRTQMNAYPHTLPLQRRYPTCRLYRLYWPIGQFFAPIYGRLVIFGAYPAK
jgi:hypothetical protein